MGQLQNPDPSLALRMTINISLSFLTKRSGVKNLCFRLKHRFTASCLELNLKLSIVPNDCRMQLPVNKFRSSEEGKGNPVRKAIEKPRPTRMANSLTICNSLYLNTI
jgi:hypothetical protein